MNKQISLITSFRKFKSIYINIQKSTMYSWKFNDLQVVAPSCEIDAREGCSDFSNVEIYDGVRTARDLGFDHQSPVLKDMIEKALPLLDTPMIALINSDIIIDKDFSVKIDAMLKKYGFNIFVVGSRRGLHLNKLIDSPEIYDEILKMPTSFYDICTSSDIFITSKFWWRKIVADMPDFILGRYSWDNWLHMFGELNMINSKYNCTEYLRIIHCDHDYNHIMQQEKKPLREAPSSVYNNSLWTKTRGIYGTSKVDAWTKIN